MLEQASEIAIKVYLAIGVAGLMLVALTSLRSGILDAFRPCLTVRPDGTPTDTIDSFHLRTWLLGLAVPSYRATALRGLGWLALSVALAVVAGSVAFLLALGLV